jgi:hypothetical protein
MVVPSIHNIAVLWDSSNPGMALRVRETKLAAEQLNVAFLDSGCVYRKPYPGLLSEESAKLAR